MIKIDETHFITADTNCFILQEKRKYQEGENKGQEYFVNLGYYVSMDSALKGLLSKEMKKYVSKQTEETLENAIKEFRKMEDKILNASKGF